MVTADTDVLIRYLTNDDPEKAARFGRFIIKKGQTIAISDVTFAEIFFVLTKRYGYPSNEVATKLALLVENSSVRCNKPRMLSTLSILANRNISLADAYCAAVAIEPTSGRVLSFDHYFDKIAGIKRIEP